MAMVANHAMAKGELHDFHGCFLGTCPCRVFSALGGKPAHNCGDSAKDFAGEIPEKP